uniref:MANSC domain-containing protein n=1 Tax=Plectus sambesii TaxID=2011161 RepID=A0A914V7H5_9BILA
MSVKSKLLVISCALFFLSASCAEDKKLCLSVYDVSNRTIIKSTESIANGAKYLGSTEKANNKQECEVECCRIPGCNIAVYHETADRDCYFFDCGQIQDFKCIFAVHDNYIAMGMMVDRADLEKTRVHEQSKHEMDIKLLKTNVPAPAAKSASNYAQPNDQRGYPEAASAMPPRQYQSDPRPEDSYNPPDYYLPAPEPEPTPQRLPQPQLSSEERSAIRQRQRTPPPPPPPIRKPQSVMDKSIANPQSPFGDRKDQQEAASDQRCNRWQWLCHKGDECIANYDLCDGIPQCSDKSDEDVEMCRELRRRRPGQIPNEKYRHDPWDAPGVNQPQPQRPVDQQAANQARPAAPSNTPGQEHGLGRAGAGQYDSASKQVVVGNQNNPAPVVTSTNTRIIALQEKTNQVTVERIDSGSTSLAALILGLGMCLLAVFIVYISCRLKTARRRVKRNGKAMDSAEGDMLINGMYL